MDINEIIKKITTADNAEDIIELQKAVKGIQDSVKAKEQELSALKDKFINVVNNYGYAPSNKEDNKAVEEDEPMDLDKAMLEAYKKVNQGGK